MAARIKLIKLNTTAFPLRTANAFNVMGNRIDFINKNPISKGRTYLFSFLNLSLRPVINKKKTDT